MEAAPGEAKAESKRAAPQMMLFSGAAKPKAKAPPQTLSTSTEAKRVGTPKVASTTAPTKTLVLTGAAKAKQPTPSVPKSTEAAGKKEGKKRQGFSLAAVPQKKPNRSTIALSDVQCEAGSVPPPANVVAKLGHATLTLALDIETAGWEFESKSKGDICKFGHYGFAHRAKLQKARMVQLGWVLGEVATDGLHLLQPPQERLIQPDGFRISPAATKECHGIDTDRALAEGTPLAVVLAEFMGVLQEVIRKGGRMVSHHAEFDMGIIDLELERCGHAGRSEFNEAARKACCTMDPEIGRWIRTCFGKDPGNEATKNTMSLKELVYLTLPEQAALLKRHHTAGADAELHLRLFARLRALAKQ